MSPANDLAQNTPAVPDAERLAEDLFIQHRDQAGFRPMPAVSDAAQAYAVQDALVRRMVGRFGQPVGYKIGLTSERMQRACGIDQPVAGVVLQDRLRPSGTTIQLSQHGHAGLEFEICIRLSRALPARETPYTTADVAGAVGAVCAAVEVIDDRHADYKVLDALSLVADNSWNVGVVLGSWAETWADLEALRGVVHLNGHEVDGGYGRDVMGGPLVPLTWLANRLSAAGRGLEAGAVVMTGNLVTTHFPEPGDRYRFELGDISAVELQVAN